MARFIYKAKSGPNDLKEGVIEAETKRSAIYKISQMGYFPLDVEEQFRGAIVPIFSIKNRITARDILLFTRQLADLLSSGLTLVASLNVLCRQTEKPKLRIILEDMRGFVTDGGVFSGALARHPKIFSKIYVSMVKSGEAAGALDEILNRLADYADAEDQLRNKVRSALAYPFLMIVVGFFTIVVLLAFVIPRLVSIFQDIGQELPLPTLMLIKLSALFLNYGWIILVLSVVVIFVIKRQQKSKERKFILDSFKLKLFVVGDFIKKAEIARFAKTLSTLLSSGVPMLEALKISGPVVENEAVSRDIENITTDVISGLSFSKATAKAEQFPDFVNNMIVVGDESGNLEKALLKVSVSCQRDVDRLVGVFTAVLEPLIIIVMGGVVGFMVISMLLPIFQMNLTVR